MLGGKLRGEKRNSSWRRRRRVSSVSQSRLTLPLIIARDMLLQLLHRFDSSLFFGLSHCTPGWAIQYHTHTRHFSIIRTWWVAVLGLGRYNRLRVYRIYIYIYKIFYASRRVLNIKKDGLLVIIETSCVSSGCAPRSCDFTLLLLRSSFFFDSFAPFDFFLSTCFSTISFLLFQLFFFSPTYHQRRTYGKYCIFEIYLLL